MSKRARIILSAESEQHVIATTRDWLKSLTDLIALTTDEIWSESTADPELPTWVRVIVRQLRKSMFAPLTSALDQPKLTPYRAGYVIGMMRWGEEKITTPLPSALRQSNCRLSTRGNRIIGKLFETFLLEGGLLTRYELSRSKFIPPDFKRYVRHVENDSAANAAEFHRGVAAGLDGIGSGTARDRSTLTTEIYFAMAIWWRAVARMQSVTELHRWLLRILGAPKVGERERIEKICQRIGLKFRARGRPRKNQTLALPG